MQLAVSCVTTAPAESSVQLTLSIWFKVNLAGFKINTLFFNCCVWHRHIGALWVIKYWREIYYPREDLQLSDPRWWKQTNVTVDICIIDV